MCSNNEISLAIKSGDVVKLNSLIAETADIKTVIYNDGNTALHIAAETGNIEVCTALIAAGSNINAINRFEATPLHAASYRGHEQVCALLLASGALIDSLDIEQKTPLMYAAYGAHVTTARLLIDHNANYQHLTEDLKNLLHEAALSGSSEMVQYFIDLKVDINGISRFDGSPLHMSVIAKSIDTCRTLLANGANPSITNDKGDTPLMLARKRYGTGNVIEFEKLLNT